MIPKALAELKSEENFAAHGSFRLPLADGSEREAVLKVSAHHRPDGSGYAVLTFLFDTGGSAALHEAVRLRFKALTDNALSPELGPDFQFADRLPTSPEESLAWHMQDLYIHYRRMGDLRTKIEDLALPGIARILGGRFGPLEWWDASAAGTSTGTAAGTAPGAGGGNQGAGSGGFASFLSRVGRLIGG